MKRNERKRHAEGLVPHPPTWTPDQKGNGNFRRSTNWPKDHVATRDLPASQRRGKKERRRLRVPGINLEALQRAKRQRHADGEATFLAAFSALLFGKRRGRG